MTDVSVETCLTNVVSLALKLFRSNYFTVNYLCYFLMHDTNSAIGNSTPLTSKNKQTEKKPERPINPSNKFFVGQQTNEFIDLHVYVDYTTVQQPFSIHDCMTLSTSRDVILD